MTAEPAKTEVNLKWLTKSGNCQCYVFNIADVHLLIDCGAEVESFSLHHSTITKLLVTSFTNFLENNNNSKLDAILISNHVNIIALPYLMNCPDYKIPEVYATEPTVNLGKLLMEELITLGDYSILSPSKYMNPNPFFDNEISQTVKSNFDSKPLYTRDQINKCIRQITIINYNQIIRLSPIVTVTPYSSGLVAGACNWVFQIGVSTHLTWISGSSGASRLHSTQIDVNALKHSESENMIICDLLPQSSPSPDHSLKVLCEATTKTILDGGSVLFPCSPTGVVYDIFEYIGPFLQQTQNKFPLKRKRKNPTQIPIYFISPVGKHSIAHATILSEYLSSKKLLEIIKGKNPFSIISDMLSTKTLSIYTSIHDIGFIDSFKKQQPCIVFCGYSSLAFGDSYHLFNYFSNESKNTIILTQPEFCKTNIINNKNIKARILECEINVRLSSVESNELIKQVHPRRLIISREYLGLVQPSVDVSVLAFDHNRELSFNLDKYSIQCNISYDLNKMLMFDTITEENTLNNKIMIGAIEGELTLKNGIYFIDKCSNTNDTNTISDSNVKTIPFGHLSQSNLINSLQRHGFKDVEINNLSSDSDTTIISIPSIDVEITLSPCRTNINTKSETTRIMIRNILLSLLNKVPLSLQSQRK